MTVKVSHIVRMINGDRLDELSAIRSEAVPLLLDTLDNRMGRMRANAAYALGIMSEVSAVPALIGKLKDKKEEVRINAAFALGRIGDASAVPALIETLKDRKTDVRIGAARSLGIIRGASAVPPLIEKLKDRDENVRGEVSLALGMIGDVSAVPALIGMFNDSNHRIREEIENALAKFGGPAVQLLIEAMKDEDCTGSISACNALVEIGNPAVPALLDELEGQDYFNRNKALDCIREIILGLAQSDPIDPEMGRAVPALIDGLKDYFPDTRKKTVDSLRRLGDSGKLTGDDFVSIVSSLKELVERTRINGEEGETGEAIEWTVNACLSISESMRKGKRNIVADGLMLEGGFPPPSGTRMFRGPGEKRSGSLDSQIRTVKRYHRPPHH